MADQNTLTRTLIDLADTLVDDFDIIDLLTLLVDRCVEVLDIGAAGLMLVAPEGTLQLAASSSDTMRVVELFELQAEEGPCLECHRTGRAVLNAELADCRERWPAFASVALDAGFASVHALPMRLRTNVIGALNLFSAEASMLSPEDVQAGQALADMATISILQNRAAAEAQTINAQLNQALTSRIVIEQAKGVLAERSGLDVDQAFSRLRAHARRNNLRLADLARDLVEGNLADETIDLHGKTPPT